MKKSKRSMADYLRFTDNEYTKLRLGVRIIITGYLLDYLKDIHIQFLSVQVSKYPSSQGYVQVDCHPASPEKEAENMKLVILIEKNSHHENQYMLLNMIREVHISVLTNHVKFNGKKAQKCRIHNIHR